MRGLRPMFQNDPARRMSAQARRQWQAAWKKDASPLNRLRITNGLLLSNRN